MIGALLFYGSEYLMHRFAFHAPPAGIPFVRRLQHRLHYDHHVEPDRLDLLFLPLWFLVPNLAVDRRAGRARPRARGDRLDHARRDRGDPPL